MISGPDDFVLSAVTGAAFGAIAWWLWRKTPGRIAAILFLLWVLRPFAQQLLSLATGGNPHFLDTALENLIFAACAVVAAWAGARWRQS